MKYFKSYKRIVSPMNGVLATAFFIGILILMKLDGGKNILPLSLLLFFGVAYIGQSFFILLFIVIVSIYDVIKIERTRKKHSKTYNNEFDQDLYKLIYS